LAFGQVGEKKLRQTADVLNITLFFLLIQVIVIVETYFYIYCIFYF